MKHQIVSYKDLEAVNNMLYELLCLRRWSEVIVTPGKFTEVAKQSLNCMIAYSWASEISHAGTNVDFTKFPRIALLRGFTKTILCDVSEGNLNEILKIGNISKATFDNMIWDFISKNTSDTFSQHLQVDSDCLESQIYRASTKISTLLELKEIRPIIDQRDYSLKEKQLNADIEKFSSLPCFDIIMSDAYQEIFRNFSKLRNRIRWAKRPNLVPSSVLGHMFDVGCYSYLMSLEVTPDDEELASKYFFMGIFHDFPECWTGDMPSPIKDSIHGLREATEKFENKVMEENVYVHLFEYMALAFRTVMLEDERNSSLKHFLKMADNFSAYVECWREIDAGSHHDYYKRVVVSDYQKKESLPNNFRLLMEVLFNRCH